MISEKYPKELSKIVLKIIVILYYIDKHDSDKNCFHETGKIKYYQVIIHLMLILKKMDF